MMACPHCAGTCGCRTWDQCQDADANRHGGDIPSTLYEGDAQPPEE